MKTSVGERGVFAEQNSKRSLTHQRQFFRVHHHVCHSFLHDFRGLQSLVRVHFVTVGLHQQDRAPVPPAGQSAQVLVRVPGHARQGVAKTMATNRGREDGDALVGRVECVECVEGVDTRNVEKRKVEERKGRREKRSRREKVEERKGDTKKVSDKQYQLHHARHEHTTNTHHPHHQRHSHTSNTLLPFCFSTRVPLRPWNH